MQDLARPGLVEQAVVERQWTTAAIPLGLRGLADRLGAQAGLLVPLAIALASRGFSILLIRSAALDVADHGPLLTADRSPFLAWDAQWYLSIAERGYHALAIQSGGPNGHHDFAFFPLWPLVIRLASLAWVSLPVASVVMANALFVAAMIVAWGLLLRGFGALAATGGLALLAFSPPAFVFSMGYSESLFLLLAGLYLAGSAAPGRRVLTAWLGMLTRIAGVGLLAAAVARAVVRHGRERQLALLTIATGIVAFAAWWVVVALISGDPMGFMRGSPAWMDSTGYGLIADAVQHPTPQLATQLGFPALLLVGSALALRRDLELGAYAVAVTVLGLLPGGLIGSMPRYTVLAFPAFAALSARLGRWGTLALLLVFAVGQAYFVGWTFAGDHSTAP